MDEQRRDDEGVESPLTDEGGFTDGEAAGPFGGGSESPGHAGVDDEYRGEEATEEQKREREEATHSHAS